MDRIVCRGGRAENKIWEPGIRDPVILSRMSQGGHSKNTVKTPESGSET